MAVSRRRIGVIVALLLAAIILVPSGPYRSRLSSTFGLAELSEEERALLSELVLNVAEAPEEALPRARNLAWAVFGRHGTLSATARRDLNTIFLKLGQGPRLFWLDAQRAFEEHRPVKSEARTQWEAELMGEGWLTMAQQRRYDEFMEKVTRQEPIESTHGIEIAVDEKIIQEIITSYDDDELRSAVALLLTPP